MTIHTIAERLGSVPDVSVLVVTFFAYAFLGHIMECIVLTIETKKLVKKRGFTSHLPFCIIYGAGALVGYFLLSPFAGNLVALYIVGAISATAFEFLVGQMQQRLFGSFWWDYSHKPFNFKGMICLESTVGWGIVSVVIIRYLHGWVIGTVSRIPARPLSLLAIALVLAYATDFVYSARVARREKRALERREMADLSEQILY